MAERSQIETHNFFPNGHDQPKPLIATPKTLSNGDHLAEARDALFHPIGVTPARDRPPLVIDTPISNIATAFDIKRMRGSHWYGQVLELLGIDRSLRLAMEGLPDQALAEIFNKVTGTNGKRGGQLTPEAILSEIDLEGKPHVPEAPPTYTLEDLKRLTGELPAILPS